MAISERNPTERSDLPPDHAARQAIIAERTRNVAVVAGAGTGKTKTIIDRAVALLAPTALGAEPMRIQRMALITFTRRAAGELRFRIREELLRQLEQEARRASGRALPLRDALANLDAAFVGTIHGFADRLLRLRPVEAALSPAYTLIEDNSELVRETFLRLRRGADAGNLRAELGTGRGVDPALIDAAAETLRCVARAGLQMERAESPFGPLASVEALLARMIETRDVPVGVPPVWDPALEESRRAVRLLAEKVEKMRGREVGHRRLRRVFRTLRRLEAIDDPTEAVRVVQDALSGRRLYKGRDFQNDPFGWAIYKELFPNRPAARSLGSMLRQPHRWLASRLVRLFPVVQAMYERVKGEHEVVDYVDLLIKLRNLLRDDTTGRRFYQSLFDHIFVDEFQDTDPLQCEIVFFLCEDASAPPADRWDAVQLAPGKLTIVGDPKQSIYRFRRADIVMYERALERLHINAALEERLETNFRSRPELITFFNQQLAKVLGRDEGPAFDTHTGRVNYDTLSAAGAVAPAGVSVHVLPYADSAGSGMIAGDGRSVEAMLLARYVRWLVRSGRRVRDPDTNEERPVAPGDLAVLACVTTNLRLLLGEFDALGIEYTARGGALFLGHPIIRLYLLALRALADRDDGVAQAALLRPPFFALDWANAVSDRGNKTAAVDERRARMQEAQAVIADLRMRRHRQSPGAVARDLIERSALARTVVTGDNGQQTLAALYEIAAELDRRAAVNGLDFDAATELVRAWAATPVFLDAPEPIATRAVRVMTIHSAKGLEFPVVILWDGFQTFSDPAVGTFWEVERDGHAWAVSLGAVAIENPPGAFLLDREKQFAEHERRRMYYVAATRARDLLVLPVPLTKSKTLRYATAELASGVDPHLVERFETFAVEQLPLWSRLDSPPRERMIVGDPEVQRQLEVVRERFDDALHHACRPIARPAAVTLEAGASALEELTAEAERVHKVEKSRFGPLFGTTVHRALELLLSGAISAVDTAVMLAAAEAGLGDHIGEASADVSRSLLALRTLGIGGDTTLTVRTEYPLVAPWNGGTLLSGYIDLLVLGPDLVSVIDFKTDTPIGGALAAAYPRYATQLHLYGEMLRRAGVVGTRRVRTGLLLTASGELRWDAAP